MLDFDSMQMRLHPAESRVSRLAAEIPAIFIAFDLLLWDGEPVHERPLEERRAELLTPRRGLLDLAGDDATSPPRRPGSTASRRPGSTA